ncbi:MAG: hypothetical protein AB8B97_05425 [Granulosicoccus sp.]
MIFHKYHRSSGHILASTSLALLAGVLGSVLTLLITGNLPLSSGQVSAQITAVDASPEIDQSPAESRLMRQDTAVAERPDLESESYTQLSQVLDEASEERAQLAQVLAQLTRQIETLESDFINLQAMNALDSATQPDTQQPGMPEGHSGGRGNFGNSGNFGPGINAQERIDTLVSVGVDLQSAQALQARQDQYQLARLELFDQAEREGWIDSEQFSDRLTELNDQRLDLREELGDEAYDRYLFEAGQSNRVVIASIIPGSQADIAGLQPLDMVIAYANRRVFSTGDLQRATRAGVRGEQVPVSVERQGQSLFFELQRGPLGVTLNQDQQNPS